MANGKDLLSPGQLAPDFSLPTAPDERLALSELAGGPVVLVFYPADWSPVCGDQMTLYQAVSPELARYDAIPLGISVDSAWCHRAFAKYRGVRFPLLADFHPKGEVARTYGAYDEQGGTAERVLYVLDHDGVVFWNYRSPLNQNPGADGILAALEALAAQRPCRMARYQALGAQTDLNERVVRRRQANRARRGGARPVSFT